MSQRPTIFCVDDEPIVLLALQQQLARALPGHSVEIAESADEALKVIEQLAAEQVQIPLVISDQIMPGLKGDELLALIHTRWPDIRTVMLTGHADAEAVGRAVNNARLYRYIAKPWEQDDLKLTAQGAIEAWHAERNQARLVASLEAEVAHRQRVSDELLRQARERTVGPLLGDSEAVRRVRREISAQSCHNGPVMIHGPAGSGLEAAARAIHAQSKWCHRPFLDVRGAMIADVAEIDRHLAVARPGTLYVHGVERLFLAGQQHLARILAAQTATSSTEADTRVILGALHGHGPARVQPDLAALLPSTLAMPALTERIDDIAILVSFFLSEAEQHSSRVIEGISNASLDRLRQYQWPGNVAELRQVIEQAVARSHNTVVDVDLALLDGGISLGDYQLIELIGEGGMGQVWHARHRLLRRPAAVKFIRAETRNERAVGRFHREARAIARLRSPHTIELYDFGVAEDGQPYFAMEMLDGLDLKFLVDTHGPLPEARAVYLLRQACRSLAEAHAAGLVHRDIKPANLFIARLGFDVDFLKVLDFGTVTGDQPADRQLTGELTTPGTAAYISPEAAQGETVDARADLYALGCTMWFMVTGRLVFPLKTSMAMLAAHGYKPPPTLAEVGVTGVSEAYESLMQRCLAKSPADRPTSALDIEEALDQLPLEPWTASRARAWWSEIDKLGPNRGGPPVSETQDITPTT